jgi:hypothetical protein
VPTGIVLFSYRLIGHGWAEGWISDGVSHLSMVISYLSDALGDLTRATLAVLTYTDRAVCAWAEEPGEYRWILERQGERLLVRILWFDETFSRLLDEKGQALFSTECYLLIRRRQPVRLDQATPELLMGIEEDVLYEFVP